MRFLHFQLVFLTQSPGPRRQPVLWSPGAVFTLALSFSALVLSSLPLCNRFQQLRIVTSGWLTQDQSSFSGLQVLRSFSSPFPTP